MRSPGAAELLGVAWKRGGLVLTTTENPAGWDDVLLSVWEQDMAELEMIRDARIVRLPLEGAP